MLVYWDLWSSIWGLYGILEEVWGNTVSRIIVCPHGTGEKGGWGGGVRIGGRWEGFGRGEAGGGDGWGGGWGWVGNGGGSVTEGGREWKCEWAVWEWMVENNLGRRLVATHEG